MSKPVVLIAEELSPATVEALGPDFEIRHVDGADRSKLLPALADANAVLIRSATKMDEEALKAAPSLKVIARAGVGLDNVDIKTATAQGVMVVNAPTSNVISAAELAIGHIMSLARNIPAAQASMQAGKWQRSAFSGVELYEKTIGIIGLGRIGTLVAQRLAGFGATLIGYDPYVTQARAEQIGVELVDMEQMMKMQQQMMSNPAMMQQAQQMMSNPAMMQQATAQMKNMTPDDVRNNMKQAEKALPCNV